VNQLPRLLFYLQAQLCGLKACITPCGGSVPATQPGATGSLHGWDHSSCVLDLARRMQPPAPATLQVTTPGEFCRLVQSQIISVTASLVLLVNTTEKLFPAQFSLALPFLHRVSSNC